MQENYESYLAPVFVYKSYSLHPNIQDDIWLDMKCKMFI